jgi:hypothetical protein
MRYDVIFFSSKTRRDCSIVLGKKILGAHSHTLYRGHKIVFVFFVSYDMRETYSRIFLLTVVYCSFTLVNNSLCVTPSSPAAYSDNFYSCVRPYGRTGAVCCASVSFLTTRNTMRKFHCSPHHNFLALTPLLFRAGIYW